MAVNDRKKKHDLEINHSPPLSYDQVMIVQELKLINKVILKINQESNIDNMAAVFAQAIYEVNPGSLVAVSIYDDKIGSVRIRSLVGINKKIKKISDIFGKDPREIQFNSLELDKVYTHYTSGHLLPVKGGLSELMRGQVPKVQCKMAEKLMNIGVVYTAGFASSNIAKGGIVIFIRKGGKIKFSSAIETLLAHTSQVIQKKQAEDQEKIHLKYIQFLSKTAMEFVEFPQDQNIYNFVGEKIRELVGEKSFVVVNSIDSKTGFSTIKSLTGVGELGKLITKKLGRNPVGMKVKILEMNNHYQDGRLHQYQYGLYELFFKTVSKNICQSIEKLAKVEKIYVIDLLNQEKFFGNIIIFLKKEETNLLKNKKIIETFIEQASIAIQKEQAIEELRTNEEKLNIIIDTSPLGICTVDSIGNFVSTNPAYEKMVGYSKNELLSLSFFDITHPNDRPKNKKLFQEMFSLKSSGFSMIKRYIRKNGEEIQVSIHAIGINDINRNISFGTAFIEDITQHKQALEKIEMLSKMPSENPQPVFRIKKNGIILYANNPGQILLQAWECTIGETLPKVLCNLVSEIYSENKNRNLDFEVGTRIFSLSFVPILNAGILNIYAKDITEQKQTEKSLLVNEKRYQKAQEIGGVGNWEYNLKNSLFWASGEAKKIFGLEEEKEKLSFEDIENCIPDRERVHQSIINLIEKNIKFDLEFDIITKRKGDKKTIRATAELEKDAQGNGRKVSGVISDITLFQESITKLNESERKFRNLYSHSPYGITICQLIRDKNENIIDFIHKEGNSATEEQTGFKLTDIVGKRASEIFDQEISADLTKKYGDVVSSGQTLNYTQYFAVFDRTLEVRVYPLHEDFFIVNFIDISSRVKADLEIKELNENLEIRVKERTYQLEAANKELESFSYSVSHDLRAPLRHISGYADLLSKNLPMPISEKCSHYLHNINDSTANMGLLIDALLKFSRTGKQEIQKTNIETNVLLQKIIKIIKKETVHREIEWIIPTLPPTFADYDLLSLVWENLLSNAVKFTGKKKKARIEIGYQEKNNEIIFFVYDNGTGFDMRFENKLFGVFQRLHSSEEFEGTGIGLANVERIILRHGGRCWAKGKINQGATFYFSLKKSELSGEKS